MTRLALAFTLLLTACADPPPDNPDMGGGDGGDPGTTCAPALTEDLSGCMPLATDYLPRQNMSAGDSWPACISDDGTFHLVGTSTPSAAARTAAYDSIARKLWARTGVPGEADFLSARDDYSIPNGIGSRVERRQDIHYPEVPGGDKFACATMGVPQMYPDRCAGPGRLVPLINDAFQRGIAGEQPLVQAARLEAALLWFFYLSNLSELWTCSFDNLNDCDSAWGYFDGARPRGMPIGPGATIRDLSTETYERAYDGLLAARCWRDLDPALPAADLARYQLASDQLDRALLRGLALIAKQRFLALACSTGEYREAHFAFLKVLVGFLDRASRARHAAQADLLAFELSRPSAAEVRATAAVTALDALYPCP